MAKFEKGNKIGNRWKKGESGNPNGRRNAAKDILNKLLDTEIDDRTQREQLMLKLIQISNTSDQNSKDKKETEFLTGTAATGNKEIQNLFDQI